MPPANTAGGTYQYQKCGSRLGNGPKPDIAPLPHTRDCTKLTNIAPPHGGVVKAVKVPLPVPRVRRIDPQAIVDHVGGLNPVDVELARGYCDGPPLPITDNSVGVVTELKCPVSISGETNGLIEVLPLMCIHSDAPLRDERLAGSGVDETVYFGEIVDPLVRARVDHERTVVEVAQGSAVGIRVVARPAGLLGI